MNKKSLAPILTLGFIAALLIAAMSFGYVKYIRPGNENKNTKAVVANNNININSNTNSAISLDLEPFKSLAKEATCTDVANDLYVIDNEMVYWEMGCHMADASGCSILYSRTPDEMLCRVCDNIMGPQTKCNDESYREFFESLNSGKSNLGLSSSYTVIKVMENGNDVNVKLIKTVCREEVCAQYRYGHCPESCKEQCVPRNCADNEICEYSADDCNGPGSCTCNPD